MKEKGFDLKLSSFEVNNITETLVRHQSDPFLVKNFNLTRVQIVQNKSDK